MSFMSWLCASFPRSKCFTDGKKQFSVVKILNSSGEMENRASWRHASFFLLFIFFLPQPHFDCKNIHPPPDFIAWEMPFLGSNLCLRYHCRSIRKEGSYFHIDFTHLLWFSAGWILSNTAAKIESYINQAYTGITPLLAEAVLHFHQEKV